ncbi:MAG: FAD-dependent oxidoreductase [Chromatiales bacterium]|nr:FAD-dependent oxidoreductase [Chromatiales bacterium]
MTFDVVVVGGGGAGLAAAIEAAGGGARVCLVEKAPRLGGSTAWSVGSISVNRSAHQRLIGIDDDPQAHFEDLGRLAGPLVDRDNLVLRRLLVEHVTETFEWLERHGLVFVGPFDEPPHRVPRMHNVVPGSRAFPERLGRAARAAGVEIRLRTRANALVVDGGRVVGVRVEAPGSVAKTLRAERGVVLAGGDYSAAPALLAELAGEEAARLAPVNPDATGDGLALGRTVGATVRNGDLVRGPVMRFVPPPRRALLDRVPVHPLLARAVRAGFEHLPPRVLRPFVMRFLTTALGLSGGLLEAGAILVNAEGERFADERARPAAATARQPGGLAWVLLDDALAGRFEAWPGFVSTAPGIAYAYLADYRRARPDVCRRGRDVAALGSAAGLPGVALARTVARYNAGDADTLGRPRLERAPFHLLGPVRAYVAFTEGGLVVNERLQVLDAGGRPIPGLLAAGSNGQGGLLLEGHGHHLGWAFVSGRLAGRHAAGGGDEAGGSEHAEAARS